MKELIDYLECYSVKKKIAIWPAGLNTKSLLKDVKDVIFKENINYIKENNLSPILFDSQNALVESKSGLYFVYPNSNRNRGVILDILMTGNYEPLETKLFLNNVHEGDIVLDIGANIGWYSLNVAKEKRDVRVFSFEPDVEVFQLLEKNVSYNKFNDKIKPNNLAVGEKEGILLFESEELDPMSHVTNKRTKNTTEVKCISLDYFVREEKLSYVNAIKCDIEGVEYFALKGAKETIKKFNPIILLEITESWCNRYNYKPIVIFNFMNHLGYSYYKIKNDGKIEIESGNILSDMEEASNFLFAHNSKITKLKI